MKLYSGEHVLLKGGKSGIRAGKWKYIEGKEENTRELFDLVADPQEQRNCITTFSQEAAELASQLKAWEQGHSRKKSLKEKISEEDLNRLKALGYVL